MAAAAEKAGESDGKKRRGRGERSRGSRATRKRSAETATDTAVFSDEAVIEDE